jgi:hypothetical protein
MNKMDFNLSAGGAPRLSIVFLLICAAAANDVFLTAQTTGKLPTANEVLDRYV